MRIVTGMSRRASGLLLGALCLALAGCASTPSGSPAEEREKRREAAVQADVGRPPMQLAREGRASNFGPAYCSNLYDALERQVVSRQVVDAGQNRLHDYPFLRASRFLASFAHDFQQRLDGYPGAGDDAPRALLDSDAFRAWLEQLRALDSRARRLEIARLPDAALPIYHHASREYLITDIERCGHVLIRHMQPADVGRVLEQVRVPDEYHRTLRLLGAYPITGIGVASSIRNWEDHQRRVFASQRKASFSGLAAFQRYVPARAVDGATAQQQVAAILAEAPRDALGIPRFSDEQVQQMVGAYAPAYEIASVTDSDRIGRLQWIDLRGLVGKRDERFWLDVDTGSPTVYYRLEFTRFHGEVLPQLVYTIWFSERPEESRSDLQAGRLDGLVWRVTLDRDGAPLAYDSIQSSGRYAMFFPSRRLQPNQQTRQRVEPLTEWLYSPIDVPIEDWVGQAHPAALGLHVGTRTHQLLGIGAVGQEWGTPVIENPPYALAPEHTLRALPLPDNGSRSIYDQGGFVPGSERRGRFVLWTMGLTNVGAIRQPGRQPTALIGRRHFDDPYLFQQRYQRVPQPAGGPAEVPAAGAR